MVILGRELKPGSQAGAAEAPGREAAPLRLSAATVAVSDLDSSILWLHQHLGLQLQSSLDVEPQPRALLLTDLRPQSFRLELLAPYADPDGGRSGGTAGLTTPDTSASIEVDTGSGEVAMAEGMAALAAAVAAGEAGLPALVAAAPPAPRFGHFTLAVPDTGVVLQALHAAGCGSLIVDECAAIIPVLHHGHSHTDRTSVVQDINGYAWQLMEVHGGKVRERLCNIMLHITDLRASLKWYTGVLGMRVHQQYESQETGYLSALVGYGPELQCTLLELRQERQPSQRPQQLPAPADTHPTQRLQEQQQQQLWSGQPRLVRFVVEAANLEAVAEQLEDQGQAYKAVQLPSSEDPAAKVPALAVADADGWQFCFVREAAEEQGAMEE